MRLLPKKDNMDPGEFRWQPLHPSRASPSRHEPPAAAVAASAALPAVGVPAAPSALTATDNDTDKSACAASWPSQQQQLLFGNFNAQQQTTELRELQQQQQEGQAQLQEAAARPQGQQQEAPTEQKRDRAGEQQQGQQQKQKEQDPQQQQEQSWDGSNSVLPLPPHLWGWEESAAVGRLRFEAEAEFVQALGNPRYLQYLHQQRYFEDPRFLAYLQYLNYWREPAYARHLLFPVGLAVLELLQQQPLRDALGSEEAISLLDRTLRLHWLYFHCDKNK